MAVLFLWCGATTLTHASAGAWDLAFGNGGYVIDPTLQSAYSIAIQPDGNILVGGTIFSQGSGRGGIQATGAFLTRRHADGTIDTSFNGTGTRLFTYISDNFTGVDAISLQADGKIVIASTDNPQSTGLRFLVVRFNPDGSLDTTFDGDGRANAIFPGFSNAGAQALAIRPDGKIVVAGSAIADIPGSYRIAVARFNPNGSLDPTFDGDGRVTTDFENYDSEAYAVAIQPDGKAVVAGIGQNAAGIYCFALSRYNEDGSLDSSFDDDGKLVTQFEDFARVNAVAIEPDGTIVAMGISYDTSIDRTYNALARYTPEGKLDTTFDSDGKVTTIFDFASWSAAGGVQADGKIVTSGILFTDIDQTYSLALGVLCRYNTDGTPDMTFGNNGVVTDKVGVGWELALQADGKIVIAGSEGGTGQGLFIGRFLAQGARSPFDFDGDAKTDISIFRPAAGEWWYEKSSTGASVAATFGSASDKLTPGDLTGDGKTDIAIFRPSTGLWYVLRSDDLSFYAFPFGSGGDIPAPADYDADGKTDAAVFRPSTSTWFISNSGGGGTIQIFGVSGDLPVAADYDGDGRADIAIYRPSAGQWWINRSSGGTIAYQFGSAADKTVPGDYTGDGKADVAIYRPATGTWFVLRSEDNSFFAFPFGTTGDVPAPGDYDGDGKMDAAVFRPSNSTWFANRSGGGTLIQQYGLPGDLPVPNAFVR